MHNRGGIAQKEENLNTEVTNAVNAAGDKAQYDARVKRILAQKSILAHILVKTVDEFKGMKPEDAIARLKGIKCGFKPTSCPDQLARALETML